MNRGGHSALDGDNQEHGWDGDGKKSVVSVTVPSVSVKLNDEPEQVIHDSDVLSRTPRVDLLPSKFDSTSITIH